MNTNLFPPPLLTQAIMATKQTEYAHAKQLLVTLTEQALKGTITWDRNVSRTLTMAIAEIDASISEQLATIMHHPQFNQLEGSWRGLHYLTKNTPTNATLKIKMLALTKQDLQKDLEKAVECDQSQLFKKIYDAEFGTPGGEPYGAWVADYQFTNHPDDIQCLSNLSAIAAAAFCPVLTAAHPNMMGFDHWSELTKPRDLEKIFDSLDYAKWRSFRQSSDARFIYLTLPRTLARLPYGQATKPITDFQFEETFPPVDQTTSKLNLEEYCWMNAAYPLAQRLTHAFATYGWCTAIRGAQAGGKVTQLPMHRFISDDGDEDFTCPTEVGITDRREAELSRLGFLPLCHYKNTDYAVFFAAESAQQAQHYDNPAANANAKISTRLPYVMATSRFAHFIKMMARDKIGAFMDAQTTEDWLNRWILQYVNNNANTNEDLKAKYPLAEAKVEVNEIADKPGTYQAVAWLRPWLQMEGLTASLRLVARIPTKGDR